MIVKVQGGGQVYANTGSCANVASYLQHEDIDRMKEGKKPEPFFSQDQDRINVNELVSSIDNNRKGLKNSDAKFYVITVAPSRKELERMGRTKEEQAAAMKDYIRTEVMPQYVEGFKKDVQTDDLLYFGKIHYERNGKDQEDLHAHIIVARKTKGNGISISPMTNHRNGKTTGAVKGSFDRCEFKNECEIRFDKHFGYDRDVKDTFEYRNAMKNGTPEEMRKQAERLVRQQQERKRQERERNNPLTKLVEAGKEYMERLSKDEMRNKAIPDTFSVTAKEIYNQEGKTSEKGRKTLSEDDLKFKSAIQHGDVGGLLELHKQGYMPEKNFFKELERDKRANQHMIVAANHIFELDALPKLEDIKLAQSERNDNELKRKNNHRPNIGGFNVILKAFIFFPIVNQLSEQGLAIV